MHYKFTKKTLDINQESEIFHFESPYVIKDICGLNDIFYFAHEEGIGTISNKKVDVDWSKSLENNPPICNPSSLAIHPIIQNLFVIEQGGAQIRQVDISRGMSTYLINDRYFQPRYFRSDSSQTKISVVEDDIIWSVQNQHRFFRLKNIAPIPLAGNGKSGYSVSKPLASRFCQPNGITRMGDLIFVADTGNDCIRGINGNAVLHIMGDFRRPEKLISAYGRLFFITDGKVHSVTPAGQTASVYEIYQSTNEVISICTLDKNDIYILEFDNDQRST